MMAGYAVVRERSPCLLPHSHHGITEETGKVVGSPRANQNARQVVHHTRGTNSHSGVAKPFVDLIIINLGLISPLPPHHARQYNRILL